MSIDTDMDTRARQLLHRMLLAAISRADPSTTLVSHLPQRPEGKCVVVGAGKAAATMAAAVERAWPEVSISGIVAVPYGYGVPTKRIEVRESAHPVPDNNSEAAARAILAAVRELSPRDLVLALISGGGSSTVALPAEGITLADKQTVTRLLLKGGIDIRTMNAVRRRLSAIKGGRLAAAAVPARVVTLAVSDIPGDDLSAIASGPTIAPTDRIDLRSVVDMLGPALPAAVKQRLLQPESAVVVPTHCETRLIVTPLDALKAGAAVAEAAGVHVELLGDDLEGESRELARSMAARARSDVVRPTIFLSGGETTVTIKGSTYGSGGRNTEFLLSLTLALEGKASVWALAADTDGQDGASGAAGAIIGPATLQRGQTLGLDAAKHLANHDSATYFSMLGDLVITGPTRTNVNDFRAILVLPPSL